jgi:uncharacterized protein YegP (UPF0339 family)
LILGCRTIHNQEQGASHQVSSHTSTNASQSDFTCHKSSAGYGIISAKSGTQFGLFYKEAESCERAIKLRREGFLCAPMNGGTALYSIALEEPLGNSWFDSLDHCLASLGKAQNNIACVVHENGYSRFSNKGVRLIDRVFKNVGECAVGLKVLTQGLICKQSSTGYQLLDLASGQIFGNEGYGTKSQCEQAIATSTPTHICGPESGGAAVLSRKSGKKLGNGYYAHLNNCIESLGKANNGVICSANDGGSSLYRLEDDAMLGEGKYTNTHNCWNAISGIKKDLVCAPGGGKVYPIQISKNKRVESHYSNLNDCVNSH